MLKKKANKLRKNDTIRVIAPSRSLKIINQDVINSSISTLNKMGYNITFAKHVYQFDEDYNCSSIEDRVIDLHEAFKDKEIKCILTSIGGYNVNQIINHIDYKIIKKNPKIICGYSDITALLNAIYAKTGLITYCGPHFSTFGMKKGLDYTKKNFIKTLVKSEKNIITASKEYSDDKWYLDQENRNFKKNKGMKAINYGQAKGTIIGGNLCTLNLLQGTEFMPKDKKIILFIEDDDMAGANYLEEFDRNLESLLQTNLKKHIKGIVIGRSQTTTNMTDNKWYKMIKNKKELSNIPVVYDADFGHTTPMFTFPIGGKCNMSVSKNNIIIEIFE